MQREGRLFEHTSQELYGTLLKSEFQKTNQCQFRALGEKKTEWGFPSILIPSERGNPVVRRFSVLDFYDLPSTGNPHYGVQRGSSLSFTRCTRNGLDHTLTHNSFVHCSSENRLISISSSISYSIWISIIKIIATEPLVLIVLGRWSFVYCGIFDFDSSYYVVSIAETRSSLRV